MKSRSFTTAKRLSYQTRAFTRAIRQLKVGRSRTERRAARSLLRAGAEYVPPVVKTGSVAGFAAWIIS